MSHFHWPRFLQVFQNDLLQQWRKIWIATLALAGAGLVAYLTNVDPQAAIRPALHQGLFQIALLAAGMIFTSMIFSDLHHPLQRFQYLTLPCSNLERFISRYLLTGPLFYLYVLVAYAIFDWIAAAVSKAMMGVSAAPFAPFEREMLMMTLAFFGLHAVVFAGAVYFRSNALLKTLLAVSLIGFALVLSQLVAVRILFWSYFTTLLPVESDIPVPLYNVPPPLVWIAGVLLYVWILFIGWRCLREHEVQREL